MPAIDSGGMGSARGMGSCMGLGDLFGGGALRLPRAIGLTISQVLESEALEESDVVELAAQARTVARLITFETEVEGAHLGHPGLGRDYPSSHSASRIALPSHVGADSLGGQVTPDARTMKCERLLWAEFLVPERGKIEVVRGNSGRGRETDALGAIRAGFTIVVLEVIGQVHARRHYLQGITESIPFNTFSVVYRQGNPRPCFCHG